MKQMKSILLSVLLLLATMGLQAQVRHRRKADNQVNKPQIHINVKKQYDKNGNIIRYDSTYVWTYSTHNGKENINLDSLMRQFIPYFRENLPDSLAGIFGNPSFNLNDSAMMMDFFNNSHFFDQWQQGLFNMQKEMETMDSLRMSFLKRYLNHHRRKSLKKNPLKAGFY